MPQSHMSVRFAGMALVAFGVAACSTSPQSDPQGLDRDDAGSAWARERIAAFESGRPNDAMGSVRRARYQGRVAYLIISPCCDQFNYLYDAQGRTLCAPSGGITGRGDGRCAEAPKIEAAPRASVPTGTSAADPK